MTLRDDLLDLAEDVREIPGELGVRLFDVDVFKRVWSGERVGIGVGYDNAKPLFVASFRPKVVQVTSRDIIASGGLYQEQDLRIGPLTPSKVVVPDFDPPMGTQPLELFFRITGPGYEGGAWFKKVNQLTTRPFRYEVVVRATAELAL